MSEANIHFDLSSGNNYCLSLPVTGTTMIGKAPELPRNIVFYEANVTIWANGHVVYDESKTDESAAKFWEAVKKYIIGTT